MDSSKFKLTDRETGKDVMLTLLGFTNVSQKVYAVCSYTGENEKNNTPAKTAIFRVRYGKEKKPEFILVEDISFCQKVMDAFYDSELK